VRNTIPHAIITTTTVLIAVAKLELTPSIPTLANIEVSAAKIADNNAKNNHIKTFSSKIPICQFPYEWEFIVLQ
jgi:hypothetical protein